MCLTGRKSTKTLGKELAHFTTFQNASPIEDVRLPIGAKGKSSPSSPPHGGEVTIL